MRKLKLKKEVLEKKYVDIRDYRWSNAYIALKSYFIYCRFQAKHKCNSSLVEKQFICDLECGKYDYHFKELAPIVNHPQKKELVAINCMTFLTLIQAEPTLLAGAFIPING
jgi:hypothetical protein